jgi:saccharopine dehydrogenase (NAD+, L-lysine-forming)
LNRIFIRREDKSDWEARVPIIPDDVGRLVRDEGLSIRVEPSPIRAFGDESFAAAGAELSVETTDCDIVMGVKEIPVEKLEPGKTYVIFSHVIKGQPDNMPALRRLMELRCRLIDYELITDEAGRRLVFFGRFAGVAGMIDSLWALGRRLEHEGVANCFSRIQPAHRYANLDAARAAIRKVGDEIRSAGLPEPLQPLVCGFAGYGQVSQGAQEIFDLLPTRDVSPHDLTAIGAEANVCHKVVFREEHLVRRIDAGSPFELQEYYDHPQRYATRFAPALEHLTLLINCIYWDARYPRLASRDDLRQLYADARQPRLRVIGDITCDIDGSVACTTRSTTPDSPVYVYDPETGDTRDGVAGPGPVVLAVDFLPCEVPVDASTHFSRAIAPFVPGLARADLRAPLAQSGLPAELERAAIVWEGQLTPAFAHLAEQL